MEKGEFMCDSCGKEKPYEGKAALVEAAKTAFV